MFRSNVFFMLPFVFLVACGITPTHKGRWVHLTPEANVIQKKERPTNLPKNKRLYLVIDDAGLIYEETAQFLSLPMPLTIAVLPYQKQTKKVVAAIQQAPDKELMLHQPMEPYSKCDPGIGTIWNTTNPADVACILQENLANVSGAKGMNNHMGSRTTENEAVMTAVLQYCKAHQLFFLDSKTAYNSMVERVSVREGLHFEERHVFLDIKHDRAGIQRAWDSAAIKAERNGYAIAIGHVWSKATADVLRASYADLIQRGYTFHLLSELYE